jgi:hypothetical protein
MQLGSVQLQLLAAILVGDEVFPEINQNPVNRFNFHLDFFEREESVTSTKV